MEQISESFLGLTEIRNVELLSDTPPQPRKTPGSVVSGTERTVMLFGDRHCFPEFKSVTLLEQLGLKYLYHFGYICKLGRSH